MYLLNQMKNGRMMLKDNGLVLLAEDVENFFFLSDAGQRLIDNLQRIKRLRSGVELADAAVDENQAGKRLFFFLQAAIAARDGFPHACEIVVLGYWQCRAWQWGDRQRIVRILAAPLYSTPFFSTKAAPSSSASTASAS